MEKYIEVMKQTKELQETVLEGLQHIQKLLNEGKYEDTIYLFQNAVEAFSSIEGSLRILSENIFSNEIDSLTNNVRNAVEVTVSAYEAKNYSKVNEILQFTLTPRYKKWKEELENAFSSYLVS